MEKYKNISRRDFFKFSGVSAGLLATSRLTVPSMEEEKGIFYGGVRYSFHTDRPIYALTIDDGWIPEAMDGMLDVLKEKRMRATFFLIYR